ncbi:MAG TPA: S49 family peptidase [Paludibacteraceae bacterium]|nr:S49 family peptidase [Paludibacteraceae bacterium]
MLQPHLIYSILNEPWAISEQVFNGYVHLLESVLNPNISFEKGEPVDPEMHDINFRIKGSAAVSDSGQSDVKHIQVITISGVLTKEDQECGPAGMARIGNWIKAADRDPGIDAILLKIDSPGGSVAGTETLSSIIKNCNKPVLGFADDMACSAAYWIISSCAKVIANNSTAMVGSIGTVMEFVDEQPKLEKEGYVFHVVTAPQSVNKRRNIDKIRSGDYEEYKETVLRPITQVFIDAVKANRGNIDEKYFTADVFFAKDVIGDLVDSIGTFEDALQEAANLAAENVSASHKSTHISMQKPELKRLAKAAGSETFETVDGSITLTEEQATAAEGVLEAHEAKIADLQQKVDQSSQLQSENNQLKSDLKAKNDRIAELEKGAGADSAHVEKDTDASDENSGNESFYERFNRLSANNKQQ